MKLLIRYKGCTYSVNFKDGMFIFKQQFFLGLRRLLRFIKRVVLRSTNLGIVLLCAILFGAVIIPVGITIEKYNYWYEGLWDMRTFLLTSVLIVFVNTNLIEEKNRRDALHNQYYTYMTFMHESERYINELLSVINLPFTSCIFRSIEDYNDFSELLNNSDISKTIVSNDKRYKDPYIHMISVHQRHLHELRSVLSFINSSNNLEMHKREILEWLKDMIMLSEEEILILENKTLNYTSKELAEYLLLSSTNYIYIIAELRRPWRWDHEKNMRIRKVLYYHGKVIGENTDLNGYWFK